MKAFGLLVVGLMLSYSQISQACSQPPQRYLSQATVLSKLFQYDMELSQAIREEAGRNEIVQSVDLTEEGYVVTLSNECQILARPKWKSFDGGGMCPRIIGFKIQKRNCN